MRTRCSSLLALAVTSQLIAVPPSSPADARIAAAQSRVGTNAKSWQPYNDLAAALCRKARDTEDVALYEQADAALQRSLELSPGNYEARKLQAVALLGKHQF